MRIRRIKKWEMLLGDGKCWRHSVWESFSIVLRPSGCFPDNHNCGGLHNPLAIYNGVWTEFAECNSDSRISGLVESDVDGIDRFCRSNLRTLVVIPRPLLLKIPVNLFNHFVPRIIFPEKFPDIFQKKNQFFPPTWTLHQQQQRLLWYTWVPWQAWTLFW